jgi:GTP-binding protein EngB required for normal cell division
MTFTNPPPDSELNEHQQRRLVVTCQYMDRLLGDLERSFSEAQSQSPFGRYANDLAPAEQRLVRDYLARLRTQLLRILSGQGLSPTPQRTGLRWAILTHLAYVDVAVEELKPHYMRGYGAVAPEAAAALNGIVEELHGTIGQLSRYLAIDRTEDLRTRLESIRARADLALLSTLEELITKYGLVEFRSALATILDTLERRGLELAVFGRVSTGKSSLLNRLLERDVLPVGVTPITAVPTRIAFGREPRLRVRFADAPPRELDVSALAAYASERENPANAKRVLRLVVELPAPFLESGVTLVDTPGLGSLATAGAVETLAYLPHCDVAAVLVDASSTITSEDLVTVGLLLDAGIRVSVLVSKADLLSDKDRDPALSYVRQMLAREFRATIPVAAVSVKREFDELFQRWRSAELEPLIKHQERERQKAAARKTEILRSQIEAALTRWSTAEPVASGGDVKGEGRGAAAVLQTAGGRITALERRIDAITVTLPRRAPEIMTRAADLIDRKIDPQIGLAQAFRDVADETAREIAQELQELFASLMTVSHQVSNSVNWMADTGDGPERGATFREVPVPALPPGIKVPAQGVERVLGHSLARSIIAKRLDRTVGDAVRSTLESHAAVLRRWALNSLEEIRIEWMATTDALHADIDRRLGHAARTSVDADEIHKDLRRLAVLAVR